MIREWVLAVFHVSAFLGLVVFLSGQITLCNRAWWNEAVFERVQRLSVLYWICVALVLLTGLSRVAFGVKGLAFYSIQPVFWLKWIIFIAIVVMSIPTQLAYARWQTDLREATDELPIVRRRMMIQAHLLMIFPVLGLLMAYGLAWV